MAPVRKRDEEAGQARAEQGREDGGKAEQAGEVGDKPRGREKRGDSSCPANPSLLGEQREKTRVPEEPINLAPRMPFLRDSFEVPTFDFQTGKRGPPPFKRLLN